MKNTITKLADTALDVYPVTRDYLKKVIVVETLHKNTTLAITRLLEIIEFQQKSSKIGTRVRTFRACWIDVLSTLAGCTAFNYDCGYELAIKRDKFIHNIKQNDFSVMKHWKLIRQAGKGKWELTKKGIGFILGMPGYRWIDSAIVQVGGTKDNYRPLTGDDEATDPITIDSFGNFGGIKFSAREALINIFNSMEK